jgi:hypothetical protein
MMTNSDALQTIERKLAKVDAIIRATDRDQRQPGADKYRREYRKELMLTRNDLVRELNF